MNNINKLIAYVRVSSKDQNIDRQKEMMLKHNVEERNIYIEKESGKDFNRPVYQALKQTILRNGDVLYLESFDRLGRNYDESIKEWKELTKDIGVDVVCLDSKSFDSRRFKEMGDLGKLLEDQTLSILSWVAEQERLKIKRRQREGIDIAKSEGRYKGRKPIEINKDDFEKLFQEVERGERTNRYAMKVLNLKHTTYYSFVKDYKNKTGAWSENNFIKITHGSQNKEN